MNSENSVFRAYGPKMHKKSNLPPVMGILKRKEKPTFKTKNITTEEINLLPYNKWVGVANDNYGSLRDKKNSSARHFVKTHNLHYISNDVDTAVACELLHMMQTYNAAQHLGYINKAQLQEASNLLCDYELCCHYMDTHDPSKGSSANFFCTNSSEEGFNQVIDICDANMKIKCKEASYNSDVERDVNWQTSTWTPLPVTNSEIENFSKENLQFSQRKFEMIKPLVNRLKTEIMQRCVNINLPLVGREAQNLRIQVDDIVK